MRRLIFAAILAGAALVPSAVSAGPGPQPHPDCVLYNSPRFGWQWMCPATQDATVHRSTR